MIEPWIVALRVAGLDPTDVDLADALWLASHMGPGRPPGPAQARQDGVQGEVVATPPPVAEGFEPAEPPPITPIPVEPSVAPGTKGRPPGEPLPIATGPPTLPRDERPPAPDRPLPVPAAEALPRVLEIGRALRPLMRLVASRRHLVLDEAETVRRIAEQDIWVPVLKPAAERRFDLALVVEEGPSMVLWRSTLTQLRLLLERQGAFRDVRTWTLGLGPDRAGRVVIKPGGAAGAVVSFPPESLVVEGNERIILLAGDGLSAPWWDGSALEALRLWGRHHPTAVLQMLPPRLWPGTGMDLPVVELRCPAGGVANTRLAVEGLSPRRWRKARAPSPIPMPVPVVWLEPESVTRWARLVAGPEGARAPGFLLIDEASPEIPPEGAPGSAPTPEDAQRLLRRFRAAASPPAWQLARYFSAVPLTLPTMRHVQRTMLPGSRTEHLAEVLLGGLLHSAAPEGTGTRDDHPGYDFLPHIRELLLSAVPVDESLQVLKVVNDYLAKSADESFDVRAILSDPAEAASRPIPASARPFAMISAQILGRLGGTLARSGRLLSRRLAAGPADGAPDRPEDDGETPRAADPAPRDAKPTRRFPRMTPMLIERFDRLSEAFERVRTELPGLAESDRMRSLRDDLANLKQMMERERYSIGFLGRSQVGKSTTLNLVLGLRQEDSPATEGFGAPATSSRTRLYKKTVEQANAQPGVGHLCWLHYMSQEQFLARRDDLFDHLGYSPEVSDSEVLADMDRPRARGDSGPSGDDDPKDEDRRNLARLLRAYERFGAEHIRSPGLVVPGDFDRRAEYTNHPRGDGLNPYPLLGEVEIACDDVAIDDRIELIDLPGPGPRLASDDLLTRSFVPELDGALIFQSSVHIAAKETYELLRWLRGFYPRLKGRVWLVITMFDIVPLASLGDAASKTIVDGIERMMTDNEIPLTQLLLVGNEFHRRLLTPDGTVRPPTVEDYRFGMNLDVDASGRPVLPPGFARHAELKAAFEAVLKDGGIGRFRQVVGRILADEVEREVRDDVGARLDRLRIDLMRLIRAAREASRLDRQSIREVVRWRVNLQWIQQQLSRDKTVESPFLELIGHLQARFAANCPSDYTIAARDLPDAHRAYVRDLQETSLRHASTETLPGLYDKVERLIGEVEKDLGEVRIGHAASPTSAWRDLREQDLTDRDWYRAVIQAFDSPALFAPGEAPDLRDHQYRSIMDRKIASVGQQLAFVALRRVRAHLGRLIEGLALIDSNKGDVGPVHDRTYDDLLTHLD